MPAPHNNSTTIRATRNCRRTQWCPGDQLSNAIAQNLRAQYPNVSDLCLLAIIDMTYLANVFVLVDGMASDDFDWELRGQEMIDQLVWFGFLSAGNV